MVKYFENILDSNLIQSVSYDYLSSGDDDTTNDDGIRFIGARTFKERMNAETLRFFKSDEVDLNIQNNQTQILNKTDKLQHTNFSFLTPSRIDLPNKSFLLMKDKNILNKTNILFEKKIRLKEDKISSDKFTEIKEAIKLQKQNKGVSVSSFGFRGASQENDPVVDTSSNIEEMMESFFGTDVEITPIYFEIEKDSDDFVHVKTETLQETFSTKNTDSLPDPIAASLFGQTKTNKKEKDNAGKINFMSSLGMTKTKNNKKKKPLKNLTLNGLSDEEIKNVPNQIKAVVNFNVGKGIVNIDRFKGINTENNENKNIVEAENEFSFELIKKIERLVGFNETKQGEVIIKEQQWKMLTEEDFKLLDGKEILCRFIPYENLNLGIFHSKELVGQDLDSYFLIGPERNIINKATSKKEIKVGNRGVIIKAENIEKIAKDKIIYNNKYIKNNIISIKKFDELLLDRTINVEKIKRK